MFLDVIDIGTGEDPVNVLERTVESCDVLLAIIGPQWLMASNPDGMRRLNDPKASVHVELATALQRKTPIIPVLVKRSRIAQGDRSSRGSHAARAPKYVAIAPRQFSGGPRGSP